MAFRPHRFGRYIIVDPIAVGGMAEIYRTRLAAAKEGPDRIIIIKKVIANLSQNSEFLQMFEEEIKITVGLTHPNIIQIYDYGKVDDQYFMAMEYVEGKNLRQFVKRLADMKSMFSIDMSCHIISQVCHALAYAHSYKDRMSGKSLGIVHRDISPQNVMISYDGAVKLFDFGIAKAKSASEATRAGVIKGKPSYLSPEQINGEELDGKTDIFALGIVLWELLTAKRLFVAETDMGVLRLIQSAKIEPPSTFNPAVPQALDAIVLKSLTRDKHKRYQTSEEFQRDLHKFLYSFNPSFNPADLSYYAQELFKGEIRDDRERLTKYLNMDPIDDGRDGSTNMAPEKKKPELSNKLAEGLISTTDFNREMLDMVVAHGTGNINKSSELQMATTNKMTQPKSVSADVKPPPPGQMPTTGFKVVPGSAGGNSNSPSSMMPQPKKTSGDGMVIPPWSKQGGSQGSSRPAGTRTATLASREVETQGSGGRNIAVLMSVFVVGAIFASREYGLLEGTPLGFLHPGTKAPVTAAPAVNPRAPERNLATPPAPVIVPDSAPSTPTPPADSGSTVNPVVSLNAGQGIVVLQTAVTGYKVTVNGKPVQLYGNQFNVPLNEMLNIDVEKFGYLPARFQTTVSGQAPVAFRVDMQEIPTGTVVVTTTPETRLSIYVGQEKIYQGQTPVRMSLPAGSYHMVMENSLLNLRAEADATVEAGKLTRVEKTLK